MKYKLKEIFEKKINWKLQHIDCVAKLYSELLVEKWENKTKSNRETPNEFVLRFFKNYGKDMEQLRQRMVRLPFHSYMFNSDFEYTDDFWNVTRIEKSKFESMEKFIGYIKEYLFHEEELMEFLNGKI